MMKKILVVFFLSTILIICIYLLLNKKEYYYLAIGDDLAKGHDAFDQYSESYVDYYYDYLKDKYKKVTINKNYIFSDIRIKDLIEMLSDTISSQTLSQEIRKADIITISIGSEELYSKLRSNFEILNNNYNNYIDNMFDDYNLLINKIRKLTKKEIIVIGYYNPIRLNPENERIIKNIFDYIDSKFIELEEDYEIKYIEINNEFIKQNYRFLPNIKNSFPTKDAYYYIYEQIKKES